MPECPVCAADVSLADDAEVNELMECPDCGTELEVTGLEPAMDLRHERRALLMPAQNERDPLGLLERHHEVGVLFARHPEDVLDALVLETPHEQIGRLHGRGHGNCRWTLSTALACSNAATGSAVRTCSSQKTPS